MLESEERGRSRTLVLLCAAGIAVRVALCLASVGSDEGPSWGGATGCSDFGSSGGAGPGWRRLLCSATAADTSAASCGTLTSFGDRLWTFLVCSPAPISGDASKAASLS